MQESAALEELRRQLELAGGPAKESVEDLRALLGQASFDCEHARLDFVEAKKEVDEARQQVEQLTETKQAPAALLHARLQRARLNICRADTRRLCLSACCKYFITTRLPS